MGPRVLLELARRPLNCKTIVRPEFCTGRWIQSVSTEFKYIESHCSSRRVESVSTEFKYIQLTYSSRRVESVSTEFKYIELTYSSGQFQCGSPTV